MSRSEKYIFYAQKCLEIVKMANPQHRAQLEEMAAELTRLAGRQKQQGQS